MKTLLSLMVSALALGASDVHAQSMQAQLVGAYRLTAVYDELPDGKKNDTWGAGVQGAAIFDPSGLFSLHTFTANRKAEPDKGPRDNVVGPFVSYYGTYSVDDAKKTITYHVEQASFPTWNNLDRTINIDELTATTLKISSRNRDPKLGGEFTAHTEWKRYDKK